VFFLPLAKLLLVSYLYIFNNSYLLETCDLQLFNEILTILLNELQRKPSSASSHKKSASTEANATSKNLTKIYLLIILFILVKTYVQALTSICRLASQRLNEHMHEIVRITLSFIENTPSNNSNDDQQYDDELIEYCLQALETYLKRCPKETNEFVPKIVDICIVYLKYDPNFNYDSKKIFIDRLIFIIFILDDDNDMSDDQTDEDDDDDKGRFK
jgi:hypothetical protein